MTPLEQVSLSAARYRQAKTDLAAAVERARCDGMSLRAIATAAGTDRMTVSRMISRHGTA